MAVDNETGLKTTAWPTSNDRNNLECLGQECHNDSSMDHSSQYEYFTTTNNYDYYVYAFYLL
jgi:nitrate/TMAO reductase-like tetraheme cytochrome c subunit